MRVWNPKHKFVGKKILKINWAWWHVSVIPVAWRLKQEFCEFLAI
jgi:hypothetical protein